VAFFQYRKPSPEWLARWGETRQQGVLRYLAKRATLGAIVYFALAYGWPALRDIRSGVYSFDEWLVTVAPMGLLISILFAAFLSYGSWIKNEFRHGGAGNTDLTVPPDVLAKLKPAPPPCDTNSR
jgi:hypothetical protein